MTFTDSNEAARDILNSITSRYSDYDQVFIEYLIFKVSFVFVKDGNKYILTLDRIKLSEYYNTYSTDSIADRIVDKIKEKNNV